MASTKEAVLAQYRAEIHASKRLTPGSRHWATLKSGWGSLLLAVSDDSIVIYISALPLKLAQRLRADYELNAAEISLGAARVGWWGTQLLAKECVVLAWSEDDRLTELAVRPLDGHLDRLRSALTIARDRIASTSA
jgi:hypothetical protein